MTLPFQFLSLQQVLEIESSVETEEDLQHYLQGLRKDKESQRDMLSRKSVQQFILNAYRFMTEHNYTVEEKHSLINIFCDALYSTGSPQTDKIALRRRVQQQIQALSNPKPKIAEGQLSQTDYQPPLLDYRQIKDVTAFLEERLYPHFKIWEKLLDHNQPFTVKAEVFSPVQVTSIPKLSEGQKVDTQTVLGFSFLQKYIGELPPVEEKKDPKKK